MHHAASAIMLWDVVSLTVKALLAQYRTAAFLAKNRDFVVGEHQALLQASADPFVAALFPAEAEANGNAPVRAESVVCFFRLCRACLVLLVYAHLTPLMSLLQLLTIG